MDLVWLYYSERGIGQIEDLNPVRLSLDELGFLLSPSWTFKCDFETIVQADDLFPSRFVILVQDRTILFLPLLEQRVNILNRAISERKEELPLSEAGKSFLSEFDKMIERASELSTQTDSAFETGLLLSDPREDFEQMLGNELARVGVLSAHDKTTMALLQMAGANRALVNFEKSLLHLAWSPYYASRFGFVPLMNRLHLKLTSKKG